MACDEEKVHFISHYVSEQTGDDERKLKCKKFRLCVRKNSFTVRVVKYWSRLPGEVVVSVLRDVQSSTGHNPALCDPA